MFFYTYYNKKEGAPISGAPSWIRMASAYMQLVVAKVVPSAVNTVTRNWMTFCQMAFLVVLMSI